MIAYDIPHPLTREWLAAFGSLRRQLHLHQEHAHVYQDVAYIKGTEQPLLGIARVRTSYKNQRKNGALAGRATTTWSAAGIDDGFATLDELIAAINKREETRRRDAEFDAAAPKEEPING